MKISVHLVLAILLLSNIKQAPAQNLDWAFSISSSQIVSSGDMKRDAQGNLIVVGFLQGAGDFDPSSTTRLLGSTTEMQLYIAKYDNQGNYIWAKAITTYYFAPVMYSPSLAIDDQNNIYVASAFAGTVDFDPGPGVMVRQAIAQTDGFILKLNGISGAFEWVNVFGGLGYDYSTTIEAKDSSVFISGVFINSATFYDANDSSNILGNANQTAFIAQINIAGDIYWIKPYIGLYNFMHINDIVFVANNRVCVVGEFSNQVDFDLGAGVYNLQSFGASSGFISTIGSDGNLIWAKRIGGSLNTRIYHNAISNTGNILTCGSFSGTADFDPQQNQFNLTAAGSFDVFLAVYDSSGNLDFANQFGGNGGDFALSVEVDNQDYIYLGGGFSDTMFFGNQIGISRGSVDCFLAKLDMSGAVLFAQTFGGTGFDLVSTLHVGLDGAIYTCGVFSDNMDIDPNAGVFNLSAPLRSSLWCARFSQEDFSVLPSIRSRDKIYVYPNPAQDYIFIDERFRNWQFRVVSASGSIALSGTISDFIIPLDIPSGLYSLQIQNSFGVWENLKFLIQK